MIRPVTETDAESIRDIYNYYVEHTVITFEEDLVTVDDIKQRIETVTSKNPWLVYEQDGKILAYAYASEWKSRCAYRFSLETTIYGAKDMPSRLGIAFKLYEKLLQALDSRVHSVVAIIALPNAGSVGLHEKLGFEKVAHFKEVGFKQDQWIDVGNWQKML